MYTDSDASDEMTISLNHIYNDKIAMRCKECLAPKKELKSACKSGCKGIMEYNTKRAKYIEEHCNDILYPSNKEELWCSIHNSHKCPHRLNTMRIMNGLCRWCQMAAWNLQHAKQCWCIPFFVLQKLENKTKK